MSAEYKLKYLAKEIESLIEQKEKSAKKAENRRAKAGHPINKGFYMGVESADEITADNLRFLLKLVEGKE